MANVLAFGCTHLPYENKKALEFLQRIQGAYKCDKIVMLGDLVDNNSISYHEHDPDLWNPKTEMAKVDKKLEKWYKAFPKVFLCRGNHDMLVDRKGKTAGLPSRAFKSFREIWDLPKGWKDGWETEIDGVRYQHGTGYSGKYAHVKAAENNRQSTVIAHLHSICAVQWLENSKKAIFGMCVGSLINKNSMAFAYGKDHNRKAVIGCGVITDGGWNPRPIKMR